MSKVILRKYGEAATFNFDLFEIDGINFKVDAVHVAGDTKIMKDEGVEANTTNGFVDEGQGYSITLTATEMQHARGKVYIVDQGTKAWLDTGITIETYGHASAQHEVFPSDMVQVSGDEAAADNLEATYDGTGYIDDNAPSTQSQLAGLANVGSAVNRPAASYTLTTGTQSANTYTSTQALDGTRHEHTDTAGALDLYYEFNIGAGFASSVQVTGYLQGNNDDLDVFGYDWVAAAWVQINNLQGKALATNEVNSYDLYVDMVGSGANQGIVRVRFYKAAGLTGATLAIDQIFTAFNQTSEGYQNAAIWFDSNASNTSTVKGIDGTTTNPVSTMAAVNTLLASTNLSRVEVLPGSTVTLAAAQNNQVFNGKNWTLDINGQDYSGTAFIGARASGIGSGVGTFQSFTDCIVSASTHLKNTHLTGCGIAGTQTMGEAGDIFFDRCHSHIAGTSTWVFDFGALIGNTNLNMRNYSGGVQLEKMGDTGIDTASIEGRGQLIEGTCTGGTVAIRGLFTASGITNLTLVDGARYERGTQVDATWNALLIAANYNISKSAGKIVRELKEVAGYEGGFVYYDDVNGAAGDEAFINGTLENPVNNETDLNTLLTTLNIRDVKVVAGSTLTLTAAAEKRVYDGEIWTLALGGQSVSGTTFHGATVSGICTGAIKPKFEDCNMGAVTLPPCHMDKCGIVGPITAGSVGDFFIADNCHSAVAGTGAPVLDFGAAIGDVGFNLRWYSGGIDLRNMGQSGTDRISVEGNGQVIINANCIGGTIAIRGHQTLTGDGAFLAAGGVISDGARFSVDQIPQIMVSTTIATLTSQTSFTLSEGSSDDDAYNNAQIVITDGTTREQKAFGLVSDYFGSSKRVELAVDPGIFTIAAGDKVGIMAASVSTASLVNAVISEVTDTLLDINKSQDLTINTTTRLEYQWLDVNGDAVDITGLTFTFKAVKDAGETSPAIPEVTGTISDAPNGRWYFDVIPTTVFKGRYEIWAVDGASKITTLTRAGGARIETHPRL